MASKILIIDKDTQTLNSLSRLMATLNFQPVIVHKWPSQIKSLKIEDIVAVFVDMDLSSINLEKINEDFGNVQSLPLFYLYSRTFAPRYQQAKKNPHADAFKKPLRLEEVYASLGKYVNFNEISNKKSDTHAKLTEFINFSTELKKWLQKFGLLMKNKGGK